MIEIKNTEIEKIIANICSGQIGIIPTDTIYGIVCDAFNEKAVDTIYDIKQRDPSKPFVCLISSLADLEKFGINANEMVLQKAQNFWPGPVSIKFNCDEKLKWLHRGSNTIVVRFPNNNFLIEILSKTGPIVATSANIEGKLAATSVEEIMNYFGDSDLSNSKEINFYINGGQMPAKASKIIEINENDGEVHIIRE